MAEKAPDSSEPLDVQKVHYLVRLMKRYDLTDLNLNDGKVQIRLKRRGPESSPALAPAAQATPAAGGHAHLMPTALSPAASPAHLEAGGGASVSPATLVIKSPMVGTYYASSSPDAPAFVAVGAVVQPESTVCIIEAMKVFTDIPAGVSGTIAEILVKNGQPVEFDQPLFRVIPS